MKLSAVRLGAILIIGGFALAGPADEPKKEHETKKGEERKEHEEAEPMFKFTGVADALYSWNANHPSSGVNQLHNFDINADAWSLASAAIGIEHEGKRFNFRLDAGFGDMNNTMVAADPWHGPNRGARISSARRPNWKPG